MTCKNLPCWAYHNAGRSWNPTWSLIRNLCISRPAQFKLRFWDWEKVAVRSWLHLSLWCSVDFSQPHGKFTAVTLSVTVIWIFLLGLASDRLCRCAKFRGNWWSETTFWVKHLKIIKTFWTMFPVKIWNSKRLFVLFLWGSSPSTLCDDADRKPKHERMQKMKSSHEKRNVTKSDKHPMCHPSCWSHTKVF